MNPKAPEAEKKVAALLYNDKTDGMASKDLHAVAALTFNQNQAELVYKVLGNALDPNNNTWQTLIKAIVLVDHLVRAVVCYQHLQPRYPTEHPNF